ncbi:MAG: S8 family serine peptidase, partial [Clostridia bacterium]|nr:S8 family serine peptidase [Clostridia bacterium]
TLGEGVTSHTFEYVTIPGVGRASDYPESAEFYKGKIVLVKRGQTTFEDKVRIALKEKGASGIIIYNNVSGSISMSVGEGIGAVCSISQDEGEMLAKQGTGYVKISKDLTAGPFMSDFSSWGPTSDLRIKPEITAHGGEILSAVPGQEYDRLSGTSMAAPNQAGATALIRQYVKYSGTFGNDLSAVEVTAIVNQLMMSTTDIISNKIGLPYAVRKQGSGLVNIRKAITTNAYITTFDKNGDVMDKTKIEYGDDKEKTGVYEVKFAIHNISSGNVSYDVSSIMLTEGVSKTYTSHGDTTVTQEGYLLDGTTTQVTNVEGGTMSGNKVAVSAGGTAIVSVKITLSDNDKQYLNDSFKNGMYVEGFITLTASSGTDVNMSVPMLAFYGDWLKAPVFDEEYYDTHKDEINAGLDVEDKLMADAYATRVIGGLYTDYIATMGSYYFVQDPSATQIAASKEHIAMSNQEGEENGTISSIYSINAGLLRNAKEVNISIVEDSTGKEVFNHTEYNQYKSHGVGTLYASHIDVDFAALEHNLKNNTRYTVTVSAYIDYGTKAEQDESNLRNVFTFPLYIDFQAPAVTDCEFYTEYDASAKK